MSVALDNVTRDRRRHPDHSRRLADARARHAQRAARADAVGQDVDHAPARRARPADIGPRAGRRQGRHRLRRAQRSVAMVYQQFINYPSLTVFENIASPLRVAGQAARGDRERCSEAARAAEAGALSRPHAAGAVRRPAAAHGDRARAGQGRRAGAAGRAAGQSRLQAARGAARPSCRAFSRRPARSSSTRRPSRLKRCCWVATRLFACGRRRAFSSGPHRMFIVGRTRARCEVFSDPPINTVGIEKKDGSVHYAGGDTCDAASCSRGSQDGHYKSVFVHISLTSRGAMPGRPAFRAKVQ